MKPLFLYPIVQVIEMSSRRRVTEDGDNIGSNQPYQSMSSRNQPSYNFKLMNLYAIYLAVKQEFI
jgi:hypothetical protein